MLITFSYLKTEHQPLRNTPTGRVEQDDRLTSPQFEARVFDAIAMITGGLPPRDIITQPGRIVRPGTRGLGAEEA